MAVDLRLYALVDLTMPAAEARRLLGRDAIIGLSLTTPRHARKAPLDYLDYVAICANSGIIEGNAGDVIAAGSDSVAVISALSLTNDSAAAARGLCGVVDDVLRRRRPS